MHAQFNALISLLRNAQVFNDVSKFQGITNILCGQLSNAFGVYGVKLQRHTKR